MSRSKKIRRSFRVIPDKDHPVRIDINGVDFLDIIYAKTISEGGLSFEVAHEFTACSIDMPVSLIISLPYPSQETISVEGKIRHISGTEFGVEFSGLPERLRMKLRKYIDDRMKQERWPARFKFKLARLGLPLH